MKRLRMRALGACLAGLVAVGAGPATAQQETYEFSIQTAVPSSSLYYKLTQKFARQIEEMSNGQLQAEVLPSGAVVGALDILDAVSSGTVRAGMAWPHYWSGKHPAFVLFSNPPASTGLDQRSFMAWYQEGGGQEMYAELLQEKQDLDVKAFLIQPMGPDPLGWFKEPIASMDDFRRMKYRAPPGIAGQTYQEMGVSAVAMPGGEIVPSADRGVIDAAEWIGPADDKNLGLQKIWKHYYIQGLHQQTDVAELTFNKSFYDGLPNHLKMIIQVAAQAQVADTYNANVFENAKAVRDFREQGVTVHETPESYFTEFIAAQNKVTRRFAEDNAFFAEVLQSQREFADTVYPYWSKVQTLYSNLVEAAHRERSQE